MSRMKIQSTTVEQNFMFGSPPLLNGFGYTTCRSQESVYKVNPDCFQSENDCTEDCMGPDDKGCDISNSIMAVTPNFRTNSDSSRCNGYRNYCYRPSTKKGYRTPLLDSFNNLSLSNARTSHIDDGIKILEQAGIKIQNIQNTELVFKKRKDLRVLKSVLSNERFREVVMKFGDGDEGGREIVESVHKAMKGSNLANVSCLFCSSESQVFDNFPVVDGTLFLTPVRLSRTCIKFSDATSEKDESFMAYICVKCMEGKPHSLKCVTCTTTWKGSFFQIGTLYSYDILSAVPCCQQKLSCNKCHEPIINLEYGEASNLFFSHFSKKAKCPHCNHEDFHFVKPSSYINADSASKSF